VPKAGFHAMRRFRTTLLRKQRAPEDPIKFWLGHAEQSVTDGYSKLDEDLDFRKKVSEEIGTGFVILDFVEKPMRPRDLKMKQEKEVAVAA
jgi:hypothetical protein